LSGVTSIGEVVPVLSPYISSFGSKSPCYLANSYTAEKAEGEKLFKSGLIITYNTVPPFSPLVKISVPSRRFTLLPLPAILLTISTTRISFGKESKLKF